jgi:16S rRNA A1518/A1519 N6-dimethyltransferase RsmA/KsgA/DIM1 with predicted DNA glycosylase/AP lyase activity
MSLFYLLNKIMDRIKGTDLYKADSSEVINTLNTSWYSTAFYPSLLKKIFTAIPKRNIMGILDLGSGKGLALILFKKKGIQNVGGVELRKDLFDICQKNLKRYKIVPNLLLNEDASLIKDFLDFNTIFLFNPFPSDVMIKVIDNLVEYYSKTGKSCYVIYVNPVCHQLFLKANFFEITSFKAPISDFEVVLYKFQ